MNGHLCLKWNNHSTAFIKSISNIQIKERYCDATIVCQGKYFPVHRVVLSTCSDYFDEMFERMQCQHPYIVFKDIDPLEMEMLLNYMYQGEVNVVQENLPTLIKAAEALRIKGLAVPDDLPSKESSGRKRGSASNEMSVPKKRSEERMRWRNSSDQTSNPSSSSSKNGENLNDSVECVESKLIKEEQLCADYTEPPLSPDYLEEFYSRSEPSSADPNQTTSNDKIKGQFVNIPSAEATDSCVKQEQPVALPAEILNNEQPSSWNDFDSGDVLRDLPPEARNQDDANEDNSNSNLKTHFRCNNSVNISTARSGFDSRMVFRKEARMHLCPYCPYKSNRGYCIKRHVRSRHTDEKLFQCFNCRKRFTEKSELQVHMRVHTGERPFQCTICLKKFTQRGSLITHKKNVHLVN